MADNLDNWVAEEVGGPAIQALNTKSAVEAAATRVPMATEVKHVVVGGDFEVAAKDKHEALPETTMTAPEVDLIARRIGGYAKIAAEDVNDASVDVIATRRVDAAKSIARFLDNAAFAVTAARNGGTVPFQSVYNNVKTNASSNVTVTAGALDYDDLASALSLVEAGDFGSDDLVIIAHPLFRGYIRSIKGSDGHPVFGSVVLDGNTVDGVLGLPMFWSNGLKTSAVATKTPGGNALMVVAPKSLLLNGVANLPGLSDGVPGYALQAPENGTGFVTDEYLLKAEVRRGFASALPENIAIIEKTA